MLNQQVALFILKIKFGLKKISDQLSNLQENNKLFFKHQAITEKPRTETYEISNFIFVSLEAGFVNIAFKKNINRICFGLSFPFYQLVPECGISKYSTQIN
jgi:hypothetical protein